MDELDKEHKFDLPQGIIDQEFHSQIEFINYDTVKVSDEESKDNKVYKTLDEALENNQNFTPSPKQLSMEVRNGNHLKPIKVKKIYNQSKYQYLITEGRIRFWAYIIICNEKNKKLNQINKQKKEITLNVETKNKKQRDTFF